MSQLRHISFIYLFIYDITVSAFQVATAVKVRLPISGFSFAKPVHRYVYVRVQTHTLAVR